MYRAVAKQNGKEPRGLFMPIDVLVARRDLNIGNAAAGGNLVPTEHMGAAFIELLRNKTRVLELGATVLERIARKYLRARRTGAGTAYWVAEGNAPTKTEQSFDQVTLTPRTIGEYTDYTRKMILQSSPDMERLVRNDLTNVLGVEIDRAAINGSGSGEEPTGILNTAGIGSVYLGTDGAAPSWADLVELLTDIEDSNVDDYLAFLTDSKVKKKLLTTEKASGTAQFVWEIGAKGDGQIAGTRALVSNNVPSDLDKGISTGICSAIICR